MWLKRSMNIITTSLIAALLLSAHGAAQTLEHRDIDAGKSKAQFSVQHIFVETVTGTVPVMSGNVVLKPGSAVPVSVSAVLDPTRIKTGEDDRDGALQTSDWFDTKRFPTWTFTSTKVTPGTQNAFGVDGFLTIHGVSVPQHLDVKVGGDPAHPLYHATGHLDRHAFGMVKTRLDPVIGGDVQVDLTVQLK